MTRWVSFALGAAVAGLFLWLTLRHIDPAALRQSAQGIRPLWLLAAFGILSLGYACRILRWRNMLRPHNPSLGFGRCAVAFTGSIAANNLLPFRAGDLLRAFGFSTWLSVPPGPVLASVLVERLLDLVALILALALALWAFSLDGTAMGGMRFGGLVLGLVGGAALAILLVPALLTPALRMVTAMAGLFGPGPRAKICSLCAQLQTTLAALSKRSAMAGLMGWTVLVWAFEGATYWAVARAFSTLPVPEAAWLVMPAGTLSTLLPSTPGHVGTFDFFAQSAAVAAGNPLPAATAYVLIAHVALWLPTTLIGGACLAIWAVSGARKAPQP